MIGAVSNNALLAAIFGPGIARSSVIERNNRDSNQAIKSVGRRDPTQQPTDTVELSDAALRDALTSNGKPSSTSNADLESAAAPSRKNKPSQQPGGTGETLAGTGTGSENLSNEQQSKVKKLEQRDRKVRQHEQAHKAAAGQYATGGASFEFTTGPNGKRYASGGEVSIDASPVSGNPRATVTKMQQIRRAALAPAEPSSQDQAVARQAATTEREARAELAQERRNQPNGVEAGGKALSTSGTSTSSSNQQTGAIGRSSALIGAAAAAFVSSINTLSTGNTLDLMV